MGSQKMGEYGEMGEQQQHRRKRRIAERPIALAVNVGLLPYVE